MSSRIGVVGMLGCLAFAVGAPPLLAAETAVPTEQDIGTALRPAPKGLGVHQGLPTLGTVPGANENPAVHGVSLPSEGTAPAQAKHKNRTAVGTTSPGQASPEARAAITFNTIQFSFGSAQLTPESSATLRNLGNALNHELKDQKSFVIEGHTDRTGTRAYNDELSRQRADAVRDYLIKEMAVSADRLQTVGKGSSEPADQNHPYAAENRRVVVVNAGG
ncbi:MAG TPA: OmpA family protein [Stellaceae bacterium]|nr:OmpA family protein [Stellaceae bacterium]